MWKWGLRSKLKLKLGLKLKLYQAAVYILSFNGVGLRKGTLGGSV